MNLEECERQLKAAWSNIDELKDKVINIEILAKHADRGYIEIYAELKNLKKDFKHVEKAHNELMKITKSTNDSFNHFKNDILVQLNKNLKWTLMFIISLLTVYGGLILLYFK